MENRKQWSSVEERDNYRANYWEKDGQVYNPKKFIRRTEAIRIVNANGFETKEQFKDKDDYELFDNFINQVIDELSELETLDREIDRRSREEKNVKKAEEEKNEEKPINTATEFYKIITSFDARLHEIEKKLN